MIIKSKNRFFHVPAALLGLAFASPVHAQSVDPPEQTKNGTLIWHEPRSGEATKSPAQTREVIIWNDAKGASPNGALPNSAAPRSAESLPVQSLPAKSSGAPDRNGIIWNDPPGSEKNGTTRSVVEKDAALSDTGAAPQQANGSGPCREFDGELVIEGQRQPMRGTACRQSDGRWRVVSQVPR